ncbi:PEP/pyruvate-binding protein [Crocosphaera subtropica ATCC 51142]|uniref:PEP/pyruvate-binding protein n=2 Tax=Crocosphaera TaxID=263510 RepID=B1WXZ5_CROS5|nr:PEP/pyruvate-binding protein [Crocosphaera subtropica ATCC 51142]
MITDYDMTSIIGSLIIFCFCPLLGGLPLIDWLTYGLKGQKLSQLGTGNVSVSAAFYHGGTLVGVLAVLSEAGKGIVAVLLARYFFPFEPFWEVMALIALIIGRYWRGKGAGTTNLFWGMMVHDWAATFLTALIGFTSFTIFRDRVTGRLVALFLLAFILTVRHPYDLVYILLAWSLSGLMAWIFYKIPDDLSLPETGVKSSSRTMFAFFRGEKSLLCLNDKLEADKVGQKAANLAYLRSLGYGVPNGWILLPGDDPQTLLDYIDPSLEHPFVVRSSAMGEDTETASAAGQYLTRLNITNQEALKAAIFDCLAAYNHPHAVKYRRDRGQSDEEIALLIQKQIEGTVSGVAFSRDPVNPLNNCVIIEALPGAANQIVSGKITPEQYQVEVYDKLENDVINIKKIQQIPSRNIPDFIIEKVAILARNIENLYHGIPQDIEWTYDGEALWILQTRSITNLQPIWTRKIASEVIPGVIRPLTWSINQPLTCGVWGDIFTLVLKEKASDLDFDQTATLHYQQAYFNATLLGQIFRRMGLPPESLEFLTRGEKITKPSLASTISNLPGLWRLFTKEWTLTKDFWQDYRQRFKPQLEKLQHQEIQQLSPQELLKNIEKILSILKPTTYYSILAPLSLSLRQALLKVSPEQLNNHSTPEIAALQALEKLANEITSLIDVKNINTAEDLFSALAQNQKGQNLIQKFDLIVENYGYLSDVATDISIPCWRDHPNIVKTLLTQLTQNHSQRKNNVKKNNNNWRIKNVQKRLDLKGKVTEIYSQFLAQLRWHFLELADYLITKGIIQESQDIFELTYAEILELMEDEDKKNDAELNKKIKQRKQQFEINKSLKRIPYIVYGNIAPIPENEPELSKSSYRKFKGIGASFGQVEGYIRICRNFQQIGEINSQTILVIPYADSGWGPLLANAGGIIAEVGGALSHGAIIAREYGIPAVMNIDHATEIFQEGQRVKIDGQQGIIELLEN